MESPPSVNTVTYWLLSLGSNVKGVQTLRGNGAHPPRVNSANKSAPSIGMTAAGKKLMESCCVGYVHWHINGFLPKQGYVRKKQEKVFPQPSKSPWKKKWTKMISLTA